MKTKKYKTGPRTIILLLTIITFLILTTNTTTSQELIIPRTLYQLDETIPIQINYDQETELQIIGETESYKLLGDSVGTQKFNPPTIGKYKIKIIDTKTRKTLDEKQIAVVKYLPANKILDENQQNAYVTLPKKTYYPKELVKMTFHPIVENYQLYIQTPTRTYTHLGKLNKPVTFYTENLGTYTIILKNNYGQEYQETFLVIEQGFIQKYEEYGPNSEKNQEALQTLSEQIIKIKDSKKTKKKTITTFYKKTDQGLEYINPNNIKQNEKYQVELNLPEEAVKKIQLNEFKAINGSEIGYETLTNQIKKIDEKETKKVYSINLENLNFTNGTATSTAKGTELWKCKEWNFTTQTCYGTWFKLQDITPGEDYTIKLYPGDPGFAEIGVASINTNKSTYKPGETAKIISVILNTYGYLVPNAEVNITITTPQNQSYKKTTINNEIMEEEKGIYTTTFNQTQTTGKYIMTVNAIGKNIKNNLTSHFYVQDQIPYEIIRYMPVTIDPWKGPYQTTIKIIPQDNNKYNFTEILPINFTITNYGGSNPQSINGTTQLTWYNLQGQTQITYNSNSPLITPDLYEIGPAKIQHYAGTYVEARTWFLAIDPQSYYDPDSTTLQGWTSGSGTTHTEIADGIQQPSTPDTNNNIIGSIGATPSEFGFSVTETNVENMTLWVYTGTGSNAQYTFELRQGTTTTCSTTIGSGTSENWYSCTWSAPSGSYTDMRVYFSDVTKSGGGKNTAAYVYAAYLEVEKGNEPPRINLIRPATGTYTENTPIDFNFTATDDRDSTLKNCSLWTNFTGNWDITNTILNINTITEYNFTETPNDGNYLWNVQCYDQEDLSAFNSTNRTITINTNSPAIENYAINTTIINQSETIYFNTSITDTFGISFTNISVEYPNGSIIEHLLSNTGPEYYYSITDTNQTGTYTITQIWANDTYNKITTLNPSITFTVTSSPPEPFDLTSPPNETISNNLIPTMQWQQTTEPNFKNYTLLLDKDINFATPDFTYTTQDITNTTYNLDFALDANTQYYWKVIAYDIYNTGRNSTSVWTYITDTIKPTITINAPSTETETTNTYQEINYSVTDTHNVEYCELKTNETGWTTVNSTTIIDQINTNIFTHNFQEGNILYNIICNDTASNYGTQNTNNTIKIDYTGPSTTLKYPPNETTENETNILNFTAQTNDLLSEIQNCKLITNEETKDTKTGITENQNFTFTVFLTNGVYNWSVNCTDTLGNEASSETRQINISVIDSQPPLVTLNYPSSNQVLATNNISFNYTPEDATGIENCSIIIDNDIIETNNTPENFVNNYFNLFLITQGDHNWTVECYDNSTEYNYYKAPTQNFSVDLDAPNITLYNPENQSLFNYSTITFNFSAEDDYLEACTLYANFTGLWEQDQTNTSVKSEQFTQFTKTTNDGTYIWNIWCNHSAGTYSYAENNWTFSVDTTPPQYSNIIIQPPSQENYSLGQTYDFNITWNDNFGMSQVIIETNFTGTLQNMTLQENNGIYNYSVQDLKAGTYYYKWYANDTINNKQQTPTYTYIVNKSDPNIQLILNGNQNNLTIVEDNNVNITTMINACPLGTINLYLETQLINQGPSPLENITYFPEPGVYNITATYAGCENYTQSSKTYYLNVTDITNPLINLSSPENDTTIASGETSFEYIVQDSSEIKNCSLYINENLQEVNETVTKNTTQKFIENEPAGAYTWYVVCYDVFNNQGTSPTYNFTSIDTDTIVININPSKQQFEQGETAVIEINTEDVFGGILQTNTTTDIIKGNTTKRWWNPNWIKRKPIFMNETQGTSQINQLAEVNISGLNGEINNCTTDIRIIKNESTNLTEVPFAVYSGDNSNYCYVAFYVNMTANELQNKDYYVYYNNTATADPEYNLKTTESYLYYAQTAAQDEPTVTNPGNMAGSDDNTFAQIAISGGGAIQESASGRQFINETIFDKVMSVEARYRFEVPLASTNWYLRYSTDDGTLYNTAYTGVTTRTKQTTNWRDITNDYAALTWTEINKTRLQGRVTKGGGGAAVTLNVYWVQLNVTGRINAGITQSSIGKEEEFKQRTTGLTDLSGFKTITWETAGENYSNYSAVVYATKETYQNSENGNDFEVVPDITSPDVNLTNPYDYQELGAGNIEFQFIPYDVNLDNCTLYTDTTGTWKPEENITNPINNATNTFSPLFAGIGVHQWNVWCTDALGNAAFSQSNYTLNISGPDLTTSFDRIWFGNESTTEGEPLMVYANITNEGLTKTNETFKVQFFEGDPDSGGIQINGDLTIDEINTSQTLTLNVTFNLKPGPNNIYVKIDPDNLINETLENNNKANSTFFVSLYQTYYGQTVSTTMLGDVSGKLLREFTNWTSNEGNIFFADVDSNFVFTDLKALGRTIQGSPTASDFSDADTNLNSSQFIDTINKVWAGDTNSPLQTTSFNISGNNITNVPYINSTNTSNFITGILWDSGDDLTENDQYDTIDKEDLVFITKINLDNEGMYGVYDYEIKVPAKLREYKSGEDKVAFYVELI